MRIGLFLLVSIFCLTSSATQLSLKVAQDGMYYLASYYGKGVQVIDSVVVVQGQMEYERGEDLPQGLYFWANSSGERIDFLLGRDQEFEMIFDFDHLENVKIAGALESERFLLFQKQVQSQVGDVAKDRLINKCLAGVADSSFLCLVLNALRPVANDSESLLFVDQMALYDKKIEGFWGNYDLSDERILHVPFFAPRLDAYLNKVLVKRHDKILEGVMSLVEKAEANDAVLRFVVAEALSLSVKNEVMGIDALGYELIGRYYLSGRMGDLPQKQKAMLLDYVRHTVNCRIGQRGKDIVLTHWADENVEVSLYSIEAQYTILIFWEPDCNYCHSVLPILRDKILPRYKDQGLAVFAVNTQQDKVSWKEYIQSQHLEDWVHGIDVFGNSNFMIDYGVQGTPFMYILDANKNIVAKNVKLDFIDTMLSRLFVGGSIY